MTMAVMRFSCQELNRLWADIFDRDNRGSLFGKATCVKTASLQMSTSVKSKNFLQRMPENVYVNLLAIIVGLVTALSAVLFVKVMELAQFFFFETFKSGWLSLLGAASIVLIPTAGGLLVGPLTHFIAPETKGHGVPELMHSIQVRKGEVRLRVVFTKLIASAITIASGGSAGREGPIVQIGGAIGSILSNLRKLTPGRKRWIIGAGCAAGIAVLFNAPVAGAVFAVEIIVGDFGKRSFAAIILGAVSGCVIGRIFLGARPSFIIPKYSQLNVHEYGFFLALGLVSALVALLFVNFLYLAEDLFENLRLHGWLKPAIGGLGVGVTALWFPMVMGTGYEFLNKDVLVSPSLPLLLIALAVLKIFATSLTLGSGGSGGIMSPSLFIGGTLGASFGLLVQNISSLQFTHPSAYALVGMAAVFAAAAQAPFSSFVLIFEMTLDYGIIVPLMFAVAIATLVFNHYSRTSIYTRKLVRRGVRLRYPHDYNILEEIPVSEIMHREPEILPLDMSFDSAYEKAFRSRHRSFPVVDEKGELQGIITKSDFARVIFKEGEGSRSLKLGDFCTLDVEVVSPRNTVWDVLQLFHTKRYGMFPVVDPKNPKRVIGTITRSDIVHAYPLALKHHEAEYEL